LAGFEDRILQKHIHQAEKRSSFSAICRQLLVDLAISIFRALKEIVFHIQECHEDRLEIRQPLFVYPSQWSTFLLSMNYRNLWFALFFRSRFGVCRGVWGFFNIFPSKNRINTITNIKPIPPFRSEPHPLQ